MTESKKGPLLALRRAGVGYAGSSFIRGIDLSIRPGDYVGIVGPNGAGKSTLLKTLLSILPPTEGTVSRRPGLRLGYVPQRSRIDALFPLTALEMVRLGRLGSSASTRFGFTLSGSGKAQAIDAMKTLGIAHVAGHPFRDLSGGQQQRVLMARALVRDPDVMVLDEPTQGMDLPSERRLLDTISELNQERRMAVILVAHQISLIAGRVKKIVLINKDNALFIEGRQEDILTDERLTELYAYPMNVQRLDDGSINIRATRRTGEQP